MFSRSRLEADIHERYIDVPLEVATDIPQALWVRGGVLGGEILHSIDANHERSNVSHHSKERSLGLRPKQPMGAGINKKGGMRSYERR